MATFWSSSDPGIEQSIEQAAISEVDAFIASRVDELQDYGWSNETIAEALGISESSIDEYADGHGEF